MKKVLLPLLFLCLASGAFAQTIRVFKLGVNSEASDTLGKQGDMLYIDSVNHNYMTRIAAGANGALLMSNGVIPVYSTATYPFTTTINQILYSSAANAIVGLATVNGSVLTTSAGGVPTWMGFYNIRLAADTLTTGQALIGTPLQFAVGANQVWQFEVAVLDSSTSAPGVEYGITVPASGTVVSVGGGQTTGATAWTTDIIRTSATAGVANATAAGPAYYQTQGTITTGATTGNVVFDFLKVTSGTAAIKAGSYISAWRIQ